MKTRVIINDFTGNIILDKLFQDLSNIIRRGLFVCEMPSIHELYRFILINKYEPLSGSNMEVAFTKEGNFKAIYIDEEYFYIPGYVKYQDRREMPESERVYDKWPYGRRIEKEVTIRDSVFSRLEKAAKKVRQYCLDSVSDPDPCKWDTSYRDKRFFLGCESSRKRKIWAIDALLDWQDAPKEML